MIVIGCKKWFIGHSTTTPQNVAGVSRYGRVLVEFTVTYDGIWKLLITEFYIQYQEHESNIHHG